MSEENVVIWKDVKHVMGIGIPWVKYSLTSDKLLLEKGLLSTTYDETRLFRVMDVTLTRTLMDKLLGVGTVTVSTSEGEDVVLLGVKDSLAVKERISKVENENRRNNRANYREVGMFNDVEDDEDFND